MTKHARKTTSDNAAMLRALASDVEEPGSGYGFGSVTGARLRAVAEQLDRDGSTLRHVASEIDTEPNEPHELTLVLVESPSGKYAAVGLDAGIKLLTALSESEPTQDAP